MAAPRLAALRLPAIAMVFGGCAFAIGKRPPPEPWTAPTDPDACRPAGGAPYGDVLAGVVMSIPGAGYASRFGDPGPGRAERIVAGSLLISLAAWSAFSAAYGIIATAECGRYRAAAAPPP